MLAGLALGREAITLRLVAAGAFIILLVRPEALVSASFQLSFAAVTAIVALHELPWLRERLMAREEPWWSSLLRKGTGLLLTGLVVEAALAPIGFYHFNRMGVYGAMANIIAIPLTTFVIMPLEAMALMLDMAGIGAPFWVLTKWALALLLWIARATAALPGGVALVSAMPAAAFALMMLGGVWLCLWRGWFRLLGVLPLLGGGVIFALAAPTPDIFVTGDGRHLGIRQADGHVYLLRPRAGDYIRGLMSDKSAAANGAVPLDDTIRARCLRCWREGKWAAYSAAGHPAWLKADRALLARTGGMAIDVGTGRIVTVADGQGGHPWSRHSLLLSNAPSTSLFNKTPVPITAVSQ